MGSRDLTRVLRLSSKHLCTLNHLTGLELAILKTPIHKPQVQELKHFEHINKLPCVASRTDSGFRLWTVLCLLLCSGLWLSLCPSEICACTTQLLSREGRSCAHLGVHALTGGLNALATREMEWAVSTLRVSTLAGKPVEGP